MITLTTLTVAAIIVTAFSATPVISHNVHCVKSATENNTELYSSHSHVHCQTLDQYIQKSEQNFISNSIFIFLPGTHLLNATFVINNVANLILKGSETYTESTIHCLGPYGFIIVNSSDVSIENLAFANCGQSIESIAPNTSIHAALAFDVIHNLMISKSSVRNSHGFGVYSNRVYGSLLIQNATFKNNSASSKYSGGNALIYYENCSKMDTSVETYLDIISSRFIHGQSSKQFPTASGLTLWLSCTNISARISNTNFSHNVGLVDSISSTGGNLAIFYRNKTNITMNKVTVENCHISNGHANTGAGMYVSLLETLALKPTAGNYMYMPSQMRTLQFLNISNTTFTSNRATHGSLHIVTHEILGMGYTSGVIIIHNCTFHRNYLLSDKGGVALYVINEYLPGYLQHGIPQFNVSLTNCTFSQNNYPFLSQPHAQAGASGAVMIRNAHSVSFTDCNFESNACSAMVAAHSTIIFQGDNTFCNNTDTHGGGLVLGGNSQMYLTPHTTVTFTGNHAQSVGGGIFVKDENFLSRPYCFFELDLSVTMNMTLLDTIAIVLTNNTAGRAGSAVYGGSVDHCFLYAPLVWRNLFYFMISEKEIFEKLFHIDPNDSSSVTSEPSGVCFCSSNTLDCEKRTYEISKFPGEEFQISAVMVGQKNGTVPGTVVANIQHGSAFAHADQYLQKINSTRCNLLNYTIYTNQTSEMIHLESDHDIDNNNLNYPTSISLSLKPCPLGFSLAHDPPYCDCAPLLLKHFKCDINDQVILRQTSAWVAVINKTENVTDREVLLVYSRYCPPGYCKPKETKVYINTSIEIFDQDVQCAFNRTGILCGTCKKGFSLVLGSSKCLECSNYYLILLLAFAMAGILLVLLLTACNLTVTEGTINGLLFYCNIISSNHPLFFKSDLTKSQVLYSVPKIFIDWVNLELGISTCFYDGMTAYAKAWLKFVFPIYIWTIAGAIILLSRRYATITRLAGRNAVKVLATLFLISYASLSQSIIYVFKYTNLSYSDGSKKLVWSYDGSIGYVNGKHIVLFIAVVVVMLLSLTYTMILASVQCLRKCNSRIFSWVPRFKPFFDAYTGPYKDSYQFWTGHLLLIRIIILLAYTFNTHGHPRVNLLLIISACAHLLLLNVWFVRGVYKKWPLDVLESSSFLNLGILSAATAYVEKNGGNQMAVTYTSVGVAMITFIGVLIYHIYKLITSTQVWRVLSAWLLQKLQPTPERAVDLLIAGEAEALLPPVVYYNQYREPLED